MIDVGFDEHAVFTGPPTYTSFGQSWVYPVTMFTVICHERPIFAAVDMPC